MAKDSDSTRNNTSADISFVKGSNNAEITDEFSDFYLPSSVREKIDAISVKNFNDLKSKLQSYGIELDTDNESLKGDKSDLSIPSVMESGKSILSAVEIYRSVFGKQSLSKLKRIKLIDNELEEDGAYHYNQVGENDPLAGTLRIKSLKSLGGRTLLHELAHALQDSFAKKNEDAVSYSRRVLDGYGKSYKAYYGANNSALAAEQLADAISSYSKQVRRYRKAVDEFFSSQGANRQQMLELASWLDAYHKREDEEKTDKLQMKLF